ncbi:type IV pilus modification protein PilV [Pseudomonadales bacterium]|jgi:type IV pilus assembly protein PilV|nr:type IV pilus modification protein PilV [Pseudomonadales bacterium]
MMIRRLRGQLGVTLIELLITMVIVSIGVLGLAGVQILSLKQAREAGQKMIAQQAANDLLDRIRVNPNADYSWPTAAEVGDCESTACTPTEMAVFDLTLWDCRLGPPSTACKTAFGLSDSDFDRLPGGEGLVSTASGTYTVTVRWDLSATLKQDITVAARVN